MLDIKSTLLSLFLAPSLFGLAASVRAQAACSHIGALEARIKELGVSLPVDGFLSKKTFSKQFAGFSLQGVDSSDKILAMNAVGFQVVHVGWKTNIAFDPSMQEKEIGFIGGFSTPSGLRDYVAARARLNFVKLRPWCARGWALLSDGAVEVHLTWDENGIWAHDHKLVFVRSPPGKYDYLLNEMTPMTKR